MNQEYISSLKTKLKKRVVNLKNQNKLIFNKAHKLFWNFVKKDSVLSNIVYQLELKYPSLKLELKNMLAQSLAQTKPLNLFEISGFDEEKYIACSYFITQECIQSDKFKIEIEVGLKVNNVTGNTNDAINKFLKDIIDPLCQYIDEQLDEQKLTIELIRRYKQKSEWFKRKKLYDLWRKNTSKGEKLLALDLYEYLFDCGLDFNIEPWSINGEPDLVSAQKEDPLIADTKIFNGNKTYIIKGFNQVYTYTLTYNQPFGYLIIYKVCEKALRFSLQNQTRFTQFISCNNKTIFITVIDIHNYQTTASQRKPIKSIEITEQELIDGLKSNHSTDI